MQITYRGPFAQGVYIDLPDGRSIELAPGLPTEVPDELAARLLEQPDCFAAAPPERAAALRTRTPRTPRARAAEKED